MKSRLALVALALALGAPAPAGALSLSLSPSAQAVGLGGSAFVDIVLSGLAAGAPPSVGAWDVAILYDASRLAVVDVYFGQGLGDPAATPTEVVTSILPGSGSLGLAATSLLGAAALDARQGDPLILARVTFLGLAGGDAAVSIASALVTDANPVPSALVLDPGFGAASIQVPEPAAAWLAASALLTLRWRRRR